MYCISTVSQNASGAQGWRQIREEQEQQLNDFLMAHSLKPDGSLSRRLKVNLVELDGGSPAKNASKANGTRQLKLLHCPLA